MARTYKTDETGKPIGLGQAEVDLRQVKIHCHNYCSLLEGREAYVLCARTEDNNGVTVMLDSIVTAQAASDTLQTGGARYHALTSEQARKLAEQLWKAAAIAEENAR